MPFPPNEPCNISGHILSSIKKPHCITAHHGFSSYVIIHHRPSFIPRPRIATAAKQPHQGHQLTCRIAEKIRTPITELFGIKHPVLLAGMNVAAGPKLAAAVTNAGGLGVIGGLNASPTMLREQVKELKSYLDDENAPFGIDLLLPQIGGSARKTKYVAVLVLKHSGILT